MKNLIYILLLMVVLSSCTFSHVVITEEELPDEVFYLHDRIRPFTGKCIIYYRNTEKVKDEMMYRKGVLNGPMTSYYLDGSIKRKGMFVDGKMEGKWESWYQDGKIHYTVYYTCDSLNGEYIEWYSTGVMKEKGLYALNKPTGNWIEYDEAGMIIRNEQYENK